MVFERFKNLLIQDDDFEEEDEMFNETQSSARPTSAYTNSNFDASASSLGNTSSYNGGSASMIQQALETNGVHVILCEPKSYSESQEIADHLKVNKAVIINLSKISPEQAKRIIDFLSGTVYAISGDIQKVGSNIFLCTPSNVGVSGKITEEETAKRMY